MARKDSSALFEVIDRGRPLEQQARPGIFSSIAAWFHTRQPANGRAPVSLSVGAPEASGSMQRPGVMEVSSPSAAPRPIAVSDGAVRRVVIDPDRREISMRLTYMTVGISIMALLTVVAAAYMAGQKSATKPRPAMAPSTDQLKQLPPQPGVTEVVARRPGAETPIDDPQVAPPAPPVGANHPVRDRNRSAGLNYLIIQSYPDQKTAIEAMNVLVQNGIDCTVEKCPPGWGNPSWFSVVGVDGFVRLSSSPQYEAYTRKIKDISDKFAKRGSFKAFDAKPYKWGKTR